MRISWRWTLVFAIVFGFATACSSSSKSRELAPTSTSPSDKSAVPVPATDADAAAPPSGSLGAPPATPSATVSPKQSQAASPGEKSRGKPIPGQYIVTLKPGGNPRSVAAIAKVDPIFVYENALLGFAAKLNAGQLNALQHNKAVQAVEQDGIITPTASYLTQSIDSVSAQPWGLDRIDSKTGRNLKYTYWSNAGSGVTAYIIDSGIATADSDFGGRATIGVDEWGGNGQDCLGHGTHVAGIVGGTRYGVAKSVKLVGVRVINCNDQLGTLPNGKSTGLAGIEWVYSNAKKPAVANMSWHFGGKSPAINTATTNLVNSGVFVAVAAANDNLDACNDSPGSAPGTLTVASSDYTDTRASDSDWGGCVDLYAPGVYISSDYLNGGVVNMSGTSMASPHVAGVAALLKGDYGDQTSATINSWILNATTPNVIKGNVGVTPNRLLYMSGW